jgi:predicted amidophosphoribosyltransferase
MTHFFYPSALVACALDADDLEWNELTRERDKVSCQRCLAQLDEDAIRCHACWQRSKNVAITVEHSCDPALRIRKATSP